MKQITGILQLLRAGNLLIIGLGLSFFYYLIVVPVHHNQLYTTLVPFNNRDFFLFLLSVLCVAAAGYIINDYYDFELDKEYKPNRPLPLGIISLDNALYLHAALAFAGIGLGFYLGNSVDNYKIGYLYVICSLLLYVYSAYLKKMPLAGNVVISGLTAFVFVLLIIFEAVFLNSIHAQHLFENTAYVFNVILWQVKFYAGFAFITNLAREIVKDIEDADGDEAYNINTFVVQFGVWPAKILVALVLTVLLAGVIFFLKNYFEINAVKQAIYLGAAVGLPTLAALVALLMAKEKKQFAIVSLIIKSVMVAGIFSIPAFYWFSQMVKA